MAGEASAVETLAGRRIVVAGSTGKIGGYVVRGLLHCGAQVVALGRDRERLEALSTGASAGPEQLTVIEADLRSESGAADTAAAVRQTLGGADGVVNAIGRFTMGSPVSGPTSVWETALEDNLTVHVRLARAFVPLLLERAGSAGPAKSDPVLAPTFTFVMGLAGETPNPATGAMAVTGAAEAMLARVLVRELGPQGVRVNGVVLGPVATSPAVAEAHPERVQGGDVAAMVAHLQSGEATALHGSFVLLRERVARSVS